jgi:membrane protease YdiL (CAAX protease family)
LSSSARPIILIASKGHLLTQIPHPTHRSSEMIGLPSSPMTTVSSPARTLGQNFMHSCAHRFDVHRSRNIMAIRITVDIDKIHTLKRFVILVRNEIKGKTYSTTELKPMEFNLFLWPMLIPMIIPLVYCVRYQKKSLLDILTIALVLVVIVIVYWPLVTSNIFLDYTYLVTKFFLFLLLPILLLAFLHRNVALLHPRIYGFKKERLKTSLLWFMIFLPIMLLTTGVIQYVQGIHWNSDMFMGIVSFFEAFSEEFFFRGILFVFLIKKTTLKIAYVTSLASFILMHPQNLFTLYSLSTILQGVLTIEIVRRSQNIIGAWFLHGANRFFQLVLLPFVL